MNEETLIEFPCQFPIKIMGKATDDFQVKVVEIVRNHAPDLTEHDVKSRMSDKGKYLSITVTVNATSKKQLDDIYLELNACDFVNMTL